MVLSLPWIVLALIAYNAIVFLFGSAPPADPTDVFQSELFSIPMLSGASWTCRMGDIVMVIALFALFIEILKSTRTQPLAILDHGLSMLIFIICLVEFLIVPEAASSLFFFITLIALIDVVAGFSVGLRAARRDLSFGGDVG